MGCYPHIRFAYKWEFSQSEGAITLNGGPHLQFHAHNRINRKAGNTGNLIERQMSLFKQHGSMFDRIAARFGCTARPIGSCRRVDPAIQSAFARFLYSLFPSPLLALDCLLVGVSEIRRARIGTAPIWGDRQRRTLLEAGTRSLFERHAMPGGKATRGVHCVRTLAFEFAGIGKFEKIAKPSLFCRGDWGGNSKNSENPDNTTGWRSVGPKMRSLIKFREKVTKPSWKKQNVETERALFVTWRAGNTHSITNSALGAPTVCYAT